MDDHIHACRDVVLVGPRPDKKRDIARRRILRGEAREMALDRQFSLMVRQVADGAFEARTFGHIFIEIIDRSRADCIQHRGAIFRG